MRLTGRWALLKYTREGPPICKGRRGSRWVKGRPRNLICPWKSMVGDFTKVRESAVSLQGSNKKCPLQCIVRSVHLWPGFDC